MLSRAPVSIDLSASLRALALSAVIASLGLALSASALAVVLPDGRVWEEVTPVHMDGGRAVPDFVSEDGQKVFYGSTGAFAGSSGGDVTSPYVAQRTSTGWRSSELLPSASEYFDGLFPFYQPLDYSSDFTKSILPLRPDPLDSQGPNTHAYGPLFVQGLGGIGGLAPTSETLPVPQTGFMAGTGFEEYSYKGASTDLTHLLFEAGGLVEDYETNGSWHYREVDVTGSSHPDGSGNAISACGSTATLGSSFLSHGGGTSLPASHTRFHAVSADGSKIFFTVPHCGAGAFDIAEKPAVNELFVRVNGSTTIPVSEPTVGYCSTEDRFIKPVPSACTNALFEGASIDGTKVFFTTTQEEEVPGVKDTTNNLYEAEITEAGGTVVKRNVVHISTGDTSGKGARVQAVLRISDDGSHVYFAAQGVLTSIPGPEGQIAQDGADNLYVSDNGSISFIGELCNATNLSGTIADPRCSGEGNDNSNGSGLSEAENFSYPANNLLGGQYNDDFHPAWAVPFGSPSSDGRFLVFTTFAQLTADDTDTALDVYEYDSQAKTLVRISTGKGDFDHNGNNDAYNANLPALQNGSTGAYNIGELSDYEGIYGVGRPASNDGSYVFFQTAEALQQEDVNSAPDVYEWHNGLVSMISDGTNLGINVLGLRSNVNGFMSSSASGSDVFFRTPSILVPNGGSSIEGIYDARIGGGFPTPHIPLPCREDACQGSISATPSFPFPTSATYSGAGNMVTSTASPTVKAKPKKTKPKKPSKRRKKTSKKRSKGSRK